MPFMPTTEMDEYPNGSWYSVNTDRLVPVLKRKAIILLDTVLITLGSIDSLDIRVKDPRDPQSSVVSTNSEEILWWLANFIMSHTWIGKVSPLGAVHLPVSPKTTSWARFGGRPGVRTSLCPVSRVATLERDWERWRSFLSGYWEADYWAKHASTITQFPNTCFPSYNRQKVH